MEAKKPLVQCRLDCFLISESLQELVTKTDIVPVSKTDHFSVTLKLLSDTPNQQRGKGYWKFNASLISDPEYTNKIKQCIRKWKSNCSDIEDNRVKWELIKFEIRSFTIKFSKSKAKLQMSK